jgi:ankyrin repeat protein
MGRKHWFIAGLLSVAAFGATIHEVPLVVAVEKGDKPAVQSLLKLKTTDVNAAKPDGSTALQWAVHRDNAELVDLLLGAGADVKAANRYGVTAVFLATENGNAAILEKLLKAGADPNTAMPGGETVLMTAARNGKVATVKMLLVHGASVNARDEHGENAMMWAASRNNADAIRMLVEFGGDIKIRTSRAVAAAGRGGVFMSPAPTSFSPLLFAVRAGAIDAVRALLEAGANVNDLLSDGESALIVAVANGHWELAGLLLDKGADPNLAGGGWNALHQAVRERRPNLGFGTPGPIATGTVDSIDVIKKMIAHGVDVNSRMTKNGMKDGQRNRLNRLGATPFFLAAKVTDVEAMRVLAAAGANPLTPNADGTTPLMVAAGLKIWNPGEDGGSLMGQEDEVLEAVKLCVELGNDVNAANSDKETPLHGAAFRGVNAVVQYLVDKGAKLDAKDVRGWTPLLIANGIDYSDFYKVQTATADFLRQLMKDRGISTEGQVADGTECLDCIQTHADQIRAFLEREKKMEAEFNAKSSAGQQ